MEARSCTPQHYNVLVGLPVVAVHPGPWYIIGQFMLSIHLWIVKAMCWWSSSCGTLMSCGALLSTHSINMCLAGDRRAVLLCLCSETSFLHFYLNLYQFLSINNFNGSLLLINFTYLKPKYFILFLTRDDFLCVLCKLFLLTLNACMVVAGKSVWWIHTVICCPLLNCPVLISVDAFLIFWCIVLLLHTSLIRKLLLLCGYYTRHCSVNFHDWSE